MRSRCTRGKWRFGSPGYAVLPLECRGWDWWRVALLAYLPLMAQEFAPSVIVEGESSHQILGIGEHYVWGASFAWALGVVMVCAPRRWPVRFTWGVFGYFTIYYTAQLLAYHYGYNGWFLASWLAIAIEVADGLLILFASRPDFHSEA